MLKQQVEFFRITTPCAVFKILLQDFLGSSTV